MPRTLILIAAIFLCVEIPPIAGTAAAALLPALLLAFVIMSISLAGKHAADNRLGGLAIGAVLAGGAWTASDLPAAGSAVLAAIAWAELPVVHWVSQLVEAAAPK